jgi:hypothetical protein
MLGNKDIDYIILENLDDKSLLNMCLTNKYTYKLCSDDNFWRKRFIKYFGDFEKDEFKTWKQTYLEVLYYNDIAYEVDKINNAMGLAAQDGNFNMVRYFISRGAHNWRMGLIGSEKGGYKKLIDFFKEKLLNYMIDHGTLYLHDWELGIDFGPKKREDIHVKSFSDVD